ncbi:tyrosine-type recombinase/integrase [bacterium]|nr:tyrosine-type recombinase/integrase [bacterium]
MSKPQLRKLKGIWYIRYNRGQGRKEKLKSTGTGDRREAERFLERFAKELAANRNFYDGEYSSMSLTLRETSDEWLEDCQRRGLRSDTTDRYSCTIKKLSALVPYAARVNAFNDSVMRQFSDNLRIRTRPREGQTECMPNSINGHLRDARTYLNWLYERQYIPRPIKVKLMKVDKGLPKLLSWSELHSIYDKVDNSKLLATYHIMEITGLRRSEISISTREGCFIRVAAAAKGRVERFVPLPEEYINEFDIATTQPYSKDYLTRQFTEYRKLAGVSSEKTLHSLRHYFAATQIVEGINPYILCRIMGHAEFKTTEIYLKFPPAYLKEIITKKPSAPVLSASSPAMA